MALANSLNPQFVGNVKAQAFTSPHHITNSKYVRVVGTTAISVFGTTNPNFRGTLVMVKVMGGTNGGADAATLDVYATDGTICNIVKGSAGAVRATGLMIKGVQGTAFNSTQLNVVHVPGNSNPEVIVELVFEAVNTNANE